jgi:hypothetical protein
VRFEIFTAVKMMMFFLFSLALKMETVCSSETLESTDESTHRQNPEHHHHHQSKLFSERFVPQLTLLFMQFSSRNRATDWTDEVRDPGEMLELFYRTQRNVGSGSCLTNECRRRCGQSRKLSSGPSMSSG